MCTAKPAFQKRHGHRLWRSWTYLNREKLKIRNFPSVNWRPSPISNNSICNQCNASPTPSNYRFLHLLLRKTSFSELKRAATDYRAEQAVQKAFCKCTNTTWEGACRRYPLFTTKDRLQQFFGLNFSKQVPQAFVTYCQAAMQAESCTEQSAMVGVYTYQGAHSYLVEKDILSLSYSDIRSVYPSFMGAHLFIAHIPKVRLWTL